jgi:hypothetical protein
MYSDTAKVGVEVKRKIGLRPGFNTHASGERGPETTRPKCFGTSAVFFCGYMKCPRREACEKLVSPWNFD